MRAALVLAGYALVVAWFLPRPLARLTGQGASVRPGLAAWLSALLSAAVSAVIGLQFLIRTAIAGWPRLSEVVCRSVAGSACTRAVYGSAAFELGVGAIAMAATAVALVVAWRCGRRAQRARRHTRAHAEAARLIGKALPGTEALVLTDPRPIAYCVPGRPAAIVLTSGVLEVLEPAQLDAVLAHERAHLARRHPVLVSLTRGLAAAVPVVPLFAWARAEVARLAEMSADDAAIRVSGRTAVITALIAIGTGAAVRDDSIARAPAAVPRAAIGAAGYAVPARLERMVAPPGPARQAWYSLALVGLLAGMLVLPGVLAMLAG